MFEAREERRKLILIEPFAGFASSSLAAFGAYAPLARRGGKSRHSGFHLQLMGDFKPELLLVAETDPMIRDFWLAAEAGLYVKVAEDICELANEKEGKDLWEFCGNLREEVGITLNTRAASSLIRLAGQHPGPGDSWRGLNVSRPADDGFHPGLLEVSRRVAGMKGIPVRLFDRASRIEIPSRDHIVVIDPPYEGSKGYDHQEDDDPVIVAQSWLGSASKILYCEKRVRPELSGFHWVKSPVKPKAKKWAVNEIVGVWSK